MAAFCVEVTSNEKRCFYEENTKGMIEEYLKHIKRLTAESAVLQLWEYLEELPEVYDVFRRYVSYTFSFHLSSTFHRLKEHLIPGERSKNT